MFQAMHKIMAEEGVAGLFKGSVARCCFHIPMTAICMCIVEQVKPVIAARM